MDRQLIDRFLDRFIGIASGATTIGLLAVADRSGLLRRMAQVESGTAAEIAGGEDLDERYVLEILSGLAAAGIVVYDPAASTFRLPAEHALFLADESSPYFMGGWLDVIPSALTQLEGISTAVAHGGGVGFEEFGPSMIRGIDRGNSPSQQAFLTDKWLPAVPGLDDRLHSGIRIADIGCGTGTAAILMARAYPECDVTGYDISEDSIAVARSRAGDLPNVEFHGYAADEVPISPPFELVTTFDVIHDLPDPLAGLSRIRHALADDGLYLMMEPNASSNLEDNLDDRGALLYGISTLHCMAQSLAVGGEGVGTAWGRQKAERYAANAGFSSFEQLEEITNRFSAFYLLKR